MNIMLVKETLENISQFNMEKTLLIALFVVEVIAFAWLIWEAKVGRDKREQIIQLEKQILKLERVIISMEKTIIKKIDKRNKKN